MINAPTPTRHGSVVNGGKGRSGREKEWGARNQMGEMTQRKTHRNTKLCLWWKIRDKPIYCHTRSGSPVCKCYAFIVAICCPAKHHWILHSNRSHSLKRQMHIAYQSCHLPYLFGGPTPGLRTSKIPMTTIKRIYCLRIFFFHSSPFLSLFSLLFGSIKLSSSEMNITIILSKWNNFWDIFVLSVQSYKLLLSTYGLL